MEGGTGINVLWYRYVKHDEHSTEEDNSAKPASNEMFASWGNPVKTAGGNGTKRPKTRPSETTPYRDRLSTIITFVNRKT